MCVGARGHLSGANSVSWLLGIKLKSPCLCGNYFICWAIALAYKRRVQKKKAKMAALLGGRFILWIERQNIQRYLEEQREKETDWTWPGVGDVGHGKVI